MDKLLMECVKVEIQVSNSIFWVSELIQINAQFKNSKRKKRNCFVLQATHNLDRYFEIWFQEPARQTERVSGQSPAASR
jgi:hypothetical protein